MDFANKMLLLPTWIKKNSTKILALFFWLGLIAGYQLYAYSQNLTAVEVMQQLLGLMTNSFWGPVIYIILYAIRPLVIFPSTILTLAGGFLFGPVLGVLYTIIASNTSATIAYLVGYYFGQGIFKESSNDNIVQRYADRMRKNSFETVMIMRFLFLPYDLVNYLAGFLRIRWLPFITATALGSIPGTIAFILAGASIEQFDGGVPKLNPATLAASILIFIGSLVLSRLYKKREGITK
ncbi:MAG: TVP38/TMEM64 family protein [Anaerolineaceae bacterium]|nr:TVP38/TMEM64 family protein [Anaerolineaceae bacterium]